MEDPLIRKEIEDARKVPHDAFLAIANYPQLYDNKHAFLKNMRYDRETEDFLEERMTQKQLDQDLAWLDLECHR
ncbi:unnamed protein product, partial [Amoebophrya sp. A25]|eukprot:GSA25T00006354001.1